MKRASRLGGTNKDELFSLNEVKKNFAASSPVITGRAIRPYSKNYFRMKPFNAITLGLFFTTLVSAQQTPAIENKDYNNFITSKTEAVITGNVLNVPDSLRDGFKMEYTPVTPFAFLSNTIEVPVNDKGGFSFKTGVAAPYIQGYLNMGRVWRMSVILSYKLNIKIDFAKLKTDSFKMITDGVTFSGPDGQVSEFYTSYSRYFVAATRPRRAINPKLRFNAKVNTDKLISGPDSLFARYDSINRVFFSQHPEYAPFEWMAERLIQTRYYTDIISHANIRNERISDKKTWENILAYSPSFYELNELNFYVAQRRYMMIQPGAGNKRMIRISMTTYVPKLLERYKDMRTSLCDSMKQYLRIFSAEGKSPRLDSFARSMSPAVHKLYTADINILMHEQHFLRIDSVFDKPRSELVMLQYCPKKVEDAWVFFNYYRNKFTTPWICKEIDKIYSSVNK